MGPDLWELYEYGEADDEVAAIIRLAHFGAVPPGVRVITQFEEIITVRLNRGDIPKISGAPETSGMSSGDTYFGADLELDEAIDESLPAKSAAATDHRRPDDLAMTGRGIVVGVIDWGFDFRHPDFRKPDGSSRILALWDQRGGKQSTSPQPYGYGVVHTRDAINKALAEKDPYAPLHYHPADADTGSGCHGTHVASIAAGTGGDGRPLGVAPEADLVFVHNAPWDGLERGKLGDSVTLLEAIDFIARTAAGRPWVINLSMGRHGEQHDGTTLIEQGLDAAVRSAAGRAICLSAGNYYNKRTHASGHLRPTQSRSLAWVVNERSPSDYNQLEVWYSWQDKFEVSVRSPDGSIVAQARLGEKVKLISGGKEIGNLYHRAQEPNTLDHHVTIYLYKSAPAGEWTVTITGVDVIHGHYHAWIEREVSCPKCQSHFKDADADPTSTTGTICNGRRTIAVGAYDPHDPGHRIGAFSSVGPTRDGRLKPDLCAPGVNVLGARSAGREHPDETPLSTRMSGTSMAAPHVAGAVALAFQAAVRPLRIEETHNLLLGSTRRAGVEDRDPDRIGIGFLDVVALVEAAGKVDNGQRTFVPVREVRSAPTHVPLRAHEGESLHSSPGLHPTVEAEAVIEIIESEAEAFGRQKRETVPMRGPTSIEAESEAIIPEHEAVTESPDSYPTSFALPEAELASSERISRSCGCPNHEHAEFSESYPASFALSETERLDGETIVAEALARARSASVGRAPVEDTEPVAPGCRVLNQFVLNHAELLPEHSTILAQVAQEISSRHVTNVTIVGHASQDGSPARNETLSRERAMNVANALRALLDSGRAGASTTVAFMIEGHGARTPVSREPGANRRVEICLPAPPPPGPVPPASTVEARLRALLSGSMVLAGNARAPFSPAALPRGAAAGTIWRYELLFGPRGQLSARDITCRVTHRMGAMTHTMPMGVLDSVVWKDPVVQLGAGGGHITLPLRASYLLGSFHTPGGRIPATTHPVWRLESVHDVGTAMVFGYDLTNPANPAPLNRLDDFSREAPRSTPRSPRVLVVCELVLCQGRADFEPGGVLEAARVYPIAEIVVDGAADIEMSVEVMRPDRSAMSHGWYESSTVRAGTHLPSLFVDRNSGSGLIELLTALASGSMPAIPSWAGFFDYFDRNTSRSAIHFVGVDPAKTGTRTDLTNREVIDRRIATYGPSVVTKVPRQGEFDNVHIAPQMQAVTSSFTIPSNPLLPIPIPVPGLGPIPVSMAPVCAHDCFHMHWRWGTGYTRIQNLGWGSRGAYSEAGAPMVAPNQKIECETPAGHAGIKYQATASHQPGGEWAYVMPHGAAYALRLTLDPVQALDHILAMLPSPYSYLRAPVVAWVAGSEDRAWAWIYFFLQYTPTVRSPHFAEIVKINSLSALRRL